MKKIERIIIFRKHRYNDFKKILSKEAFLSEIELKNYLQSQFEFNITVTREDISKFCLLKDCDGRENIFFSNKNNYTEGTYSLEIIKVHIEGNNFHIYRKPTKGYQRKKAENLARVFNEDSDKEFRLKFVKLGSPHIGLVKNKKTRNFFFWNGTPIPVGAFEYYNIYLINNKMQIGTTKEFLINKCKQSTYKSLKSQVFIEGVDFEIKYYEANDEYYADVKL